VNYFLDKHRGVSKKTVNGVSAGALQCLMEYPWPGNVRELENAILRGLVLCRADFIEVEDLPEELTCLEGEEAKTAAADRQELKQMKKQAQQKVKEEVEKNFIIEALRKGEGNVLRSAALVNMDRRQFQNLIKKYGVVKEEFKK
jgi:DNA-binding NtrC family response regulator